MQQLKTFQSFDNAGIWTLDLSVVYCLRARAENKGGPLGFCQFWRSEGPWNNINFHWKVIPLTPVPYLNQWTMA